MPVALFPLILASEKYTSFHQCTLQEKVYYDSSPANTEAMQNFKLPQKSVNTAKVVA